MSKTGAPTTAALLEVDASSAIFDSGTYFTFVPTDSDSPISFAQLNVSSRPKLVSGILTRRCFTCGMETGVMVEIYVQEQIGEGEVISVALAQCGATTYSDNQAYRD